MREDSRLGRDDHQAIADSLRCALDKVGMSPAELCRRTGLHPSHISRVLGGKRGLSHNSRVMIAQLIPLPLPDGEVADELFSSMTMNETYEFLHDLERWGMRRSHFLFLQTHPEERRMVTTLIRKLSGIQIK